MAITPLASCFSGRLGIFSDSAKSPRLNSVLGTELFYTSKSSACNELVGGGQIRHPAKHFSQSQE
jgi:hypothetical protein